MQQKLGRELEVDTQLRGNMSWLRGSVKNVIIWATPSDANMAQQSTRYMNEMILFHGAPKHNSSFYYHGECGRPQRLWVTIMAENC